MVQTGRTVLTLPKMLTLFAAIGGIVSPVLGVSQSGDPDDPIPLDEIVVTAPAIESELTDVPSALTIITREEIEQSKAASVFELLNTVVASNVLDETGNGNTQHLAFRAYESWRASNSVVMLNGIPIRNFFNVPIEPVGIERIEIIRGPSSVVYGGRVSGGVINIVTRTGGHEKLAIRPQFSAGSFGLRKVEAFLGGSTDRTSYQVSGLHKRGDGFRDRNSRYEVTNVSARLIRQLDDRSLVSMNLLYWNGDKEFPGGFADLDDLKADPTPVFIDSVSEWPQKNLGGNIAYESRFTPAHSVAANFFFSLREQTQILDFRNPGSDKPNVRKSVRDRSNLGFVARYRYERKIGPAHSALLTGTDIEWDDFDNVRHRAPGGTITGPPLTDQNTGNLITAVYALSEVRLDPSARISAGLRFERIDNRSTDNIRPENSGSKAMSVFIPAIGAEFTPDPRVGIYGNIVRTFRPPQPQQVIDPVQGNRDLEPAISYKYELGMRFEPTTAIDLSLAGYYETYAQDIVRVTVQSNEGRTQQLQNVGETTRRGVEAELRLVLAAPSPGRFGLSLFANGALQRGEFSEHPTFEGNTIPYVPGRRAALGMRFVGKSGFSVSANATYVGRQWGDNNNRSQFQIPSYTLLNAMTRYDHGRFTIYLKANNLLDRAHAVLYKAVLHGFLPGPPRNFETGVLLKY